MPANEENMKDGYTQNPKEQAGYLSLLSFWWMQKLMKQGSERALKGEDLPPLLKGDQSQRLVETLEKEWEQEVQDCRQGGTQPKLWKAVLRMIPARDYFVFISQRVMFSISFVLTPLILWFFLRALNRASDVDHKMLFLYIALLGLAAITKSLTTHHSFHIGDLWSIRIKVGTVGLIYKKVSSRNVLEA